jgi:hypothetical protein
MIGMVEHIIDVSIDLGTLDSGATSRRPQSRLRQGMSR